MAHPVKLLPDSYKDGESDERIWSVAGWREAAGHFDETELAGLLVAIANVNAWNRLNAAIRLVAGARNP
ncbi:hypothetical protein [Nonomuraea sp. NPDC049695]|uniref:hypothetical protein n=1 Tax=Nonomuraea sp. NPDC049695 TaxID=3154734 RepID=UPI00342CEAC1